MFFINRLKPSVCQLLLLLLASRYQSCFRTRPLNRTKYTLHKVHTTQTLAHEEIRSPKWWVFKFWSKNIFTCEANNNNSLSPQVWQDGHYCKGHKRTATHMLDWIAPTMSPPSLLQQLTHFEAPPTMSGQTALESKVKTPDYPIHEY
jgi:hypothetical protein